MRNLLKFRRITERPSLKERAAGLKASLSQVVAQPRPMPAPGSEEAKAAFKDACHQHTIRTQFANGYPELKRTEIEWWTADSIGKALETGELTPAECARLYPLATERELRMAEIEHELNLGGLFALAFAESYPVTADEQDTSEDDLSLDAELLHLGQQFEAARERETAACEACNAAQREADRHMPERPACLTLRVSDHPLNVYPHRMHPDALEGIQLGTADIEWLRRKMPMMHEVLRPIREGERAHVDHPGRKFDIVPHPEAQARAEEIVAASDAWHAERVRIHGEYVTQALDDAANDAGNAAVALAERIAALPARTAEGFRVKLRALSHYRRNTLLSEITDEPDPDQLLSHSLWRDVQGEGVASDDGHAATVEEAASLDFTAYAFDIPIRDPNGWMEEFSHHAIGMHISDRTLRMSKPELVAFIQKGGERDADVPGTMLAALDSAQKTFEGWGKLLDVARTRYLVAASSAVLTHEGTPPENAAPEPQQEERPAPVPLPASSVAGMLDLASATMDELQAVHDVAERIGSVAYAHAWGARCRSGENKHGAPYFNVAGDLVQWIGDALTAVETAVHEEARRRVPDGAFEREVRLQILAAPVTQNGDDDEVEAFARELLAHSVALREGR
ncbi:hypothetical protein ACQKQD_18295 [Methylobacterium sp. NPDC080182]|uniref:hypothetical protein n=1 Tax=Methylobacterium sp. NPDC080182 TaxID=3390590 RepID=UPI003D014422